MSYPSNPTQLYNQQQQQQQPQMYGTPQQQPSLYSGQGHQMYTGISPQPFNATSPYQASSLQQQHHLGLSTTPSSIGLGSAQQIPYSSLYLQTTPGQYQAPQPTPYYSPPTLSSTSIDPMINQYFQAADKNRDGYIDSHELRGALSQCGFVFDDEISRKLVRMFDKNLNKWIDTNEFVTLYLYLNQMKQAFNSVDTNKNGVLEFQEVEQALLQGGFRINPQVVQKLFKVFDVQSKGALNFDGYLKLCIFLGTVKQGFGYLDLNRNGVVQCNFDQYVDSCINLS